jgi:D-alanine-D-alanine ligase
VAVLMGGRSSEREVSRESGRMILEALGTPDDSLDARGPARVLPIEILEDGRWRIDGADLEVGVALRRLAEVDLVFSALHGGEGEDGTIQGLLTSAGIAFTGSGVAASAVCLDKVFARHLIRSQGVRVARAALVGRLEWERGRAQELERLRSWDEAGWVVKPRFGGSSVGAAVARSQEELAAALDEAFRWEEEALVEALVRGTELTGGVVVDALGRLRALTPIEIQPHEGRFFDYEEKYSAEGAAELCPPVSVGAEVCRRIEELSLLAHRFLRCAGYSRSDFVLPEQGGDPVFLEINTLPGLTQRSLVPLAAQHDGIDYRTLCLWIAHEGLRRRRERSDGLASQGGA